MSAGTLQVKLMLDPQDRVYYGPGDPITGHVELYYRSSKTSETPRSGSQGASNLFGPLNLTLKLYGRILTQASEVGDKQYVFKDKAKLFESWHVVHQGPYRMEAEERARFPFAINFPSGPPDVEMTDELPPSLKCTFFEKSMLPGGDAAVEYWLEPQVIFPVVEVTPHAVFKDRQVMYERPPINAVPSSESIMMGGEAVVQSSGLITESEKPRGFRERSKSIFKDPPIYRFAVKCTGVRSILCLGEPTELEVAVRTVEKESTVSSTPDVLLDHVKVDIVAHTMIEVDERWLRSSQPTDAQVVRTVYGDTSPGPFSKADDYTKKVTIPAITRVPSTFSCGRVSRTYKLRLELQFRVAGEIRHVRRDIPVTIYPPLSEHARIAQAGSSRAPAQQHDEDLPAYDASMPPHIDAAS